MCSEVEVCHLACVCYIFVMHKLPIWDLWWLSLQLCSSAFRTAADVPSNASSEKACHLQLLSSNQISVLRGLHPILGSVLKLPCSRHPPFLMVSIPNSICPYCYLPSMLYAANQQSAAKQTASVHRIVLSCKLTVRPSDCLDMQKACSRLVPLVLRPWFCQPAALQLVGQQPSLSTLLSPRLLAV